MATTEAEIHELMRAWRGVMAASRPRWSAADLTFTQLRALWAIARRGSIRVSELGDELGIGLAGASALADRMARRLFITRQADPDDRRIVRLEVAPRGRHLLDRLERGSIDHFGKLIGRMTPEERDAFATTLRAFARLGAEQAAARDTKC